MTEALPARPNLEWYKKSAKKKLAQLRAKDRAARLADAQLAIARQFGFSSWRKLKSHIEASVDGASELLAACADGNLATVRRILRHSPNLIAARDERGMTPLHAVVCANFRPLTRGHLDALRLLLQQKPDLEALAEEGNIGRCTPLHLAAFSGRDRLQVVQMLLAAGAKWNVTGSDGSTPLFDAARHGAMEIAVMLLAAGAPATLHDAIALDRPDVAEQILRRDPDALTRPHPKDQTTPIANARTGRMREFLLAAGAKPTIHEAAALGWTEMARKLLDADPSQVHQRDHTRRTPLHRAIDWGHVEMVQFLLERGADPTAPWLPGWTPLELAKRRNHPDILELLQKATSSAPMPSFDQIAQQAVRAMERAWAESHAVIEKRFDEVGDGPRWEFTGFQSPTMREREADERIIRHDVMGSYRMVSVWTTLRISAKGDSQIEAPFAPTRMLEFFRGGNDILHPTDGLWRRIEWHPSRRGFSGKPGRWDDLAEAIKFLSRAPAAGEYRVITIRRLLHATRLKDRVKIAKHHANASQLS